MPEFGVIGNIDEGGYVYPFTWDDWAEWSNRRFEGQTPARVLWTAKSNCQEKFRMMPAGFENPET